MAREIKLSEITPSKKSLIRALKSTRKAYGFIRLNEHSGVRIELVKSSLLKALEQFSDEDELDNFTITDRSIYID